MVLRICVIIVFGAFVCSEAWSQIRFDTIKVQTKDFVYDSRTDKIYATIPSINGANGNSLGIINPNTLKLEKTVFMGLEPTVMSLSDDGKYIYTGFSGAPIVRRFDVATQTAGLQIDLGNSQFGANLFAFDLAVLPKKSSSFAVSRKDVRISSVTEGIAIFDNDTMRATVSPRIPNVNKIAFLSDSILCGYENEISSFKFSKFAVTRAGVEQRSVTNGVPNNTRFGLKFVTHQQKAYFTDGSIVDVSNEPTVLGRINNTISAPVVYDTHKNLLCFASTDNNATVVIRRYNPETFLLYDVISTINVFPNSAVGIGKLVTCGNNCYALNYARDLVNFDYVMIIRTPTNAVKFINNGDSKITIYPNPASLSIGIQSVMENDNWIKYAITNINGTIVKTEKLANFNSNNEINISELPKGIYFLQLINDENKMFFNKFIKN